MHDQRDLSRCSPLNACTPAGPGSASTPTTSITVNCGLTTSHKALLSFASFLYISGRLPHSLDQIAPLLYTAQFVPIGTSTCNSGFPVNTPTPSTDPSQVFVVCVPYTSDSRRLRDSTAFWEGVLTGTGYK